MKLNTPVSEIMTSNLVLLKTTDQLDTAERLFKKHKIRHIPVVEGKKIKGILSLTDLLRISFADVVDDDSEDSDVEAIIYNMFTISQVMAKAPITVSSSTNIREVAEILSKEEFHALPVVDNEILVGIVTTTDLLKFMLKD